MSNNTVIDIKNPELKSNDLLTDLIRSSAKAMLVRAVQVELEDFLEKHASLTTSDDKARMVRNGYLPERQIITGVGYIDVKIPRVRERGKEQEKINFTSNIIPKHLRRSTSIEELLPLLYLKGISTNDFQQALQPLLGANAKNISPSTISKLKASWEQEYITWNKQDLTGKEYVYWWVDGIYLQARMEEAKNCVFATKAYKIFIKNFKAKYPKAVECLEKDQDKLLTFYDFPAENWQHISTTNPIESTFATIKYRTYKAKGCFSQTTILTMVFKLCLDAQTRWEKLYGFNKLAEVIRGVQFINGVKAKHKSTNSNKNKAA